MDLMWFDSKPVFHILYTATRLSSVMFLNSNGVNYGQSVEGVWSVFIETCCIMYTGYPNRLRANQDSVFRSERWENITDILGIELRLSGFRAHSSIGIGDKVHDPLRRINKKAKL